MKDGFLVELMRIDGYSDKEITTFIAGRDSGYEKGYKYGIRNQWSKGTFIGLGILLLCIFLCISLVVFSCAYYEKVSQENLMKKYSCTYD